ncbi:hypothetical protein JVU11DRAFT_8813 [Chiua virens]|nr:hypothetical protein JVU11DRAFT_8813 [Chiua virens]
MPSLSPSENGAKPASRFSTLNVFKLKSGSNPGPLGLYLNYFLSGQPVSLFVDPAPPLPPKDSTYASSPLPSLNPPPSAFYNKPFFSRSATSLAPSLSPASYSGPVTPASPLPPMPNAALDFGKRSNNGLAVNGRAAAPSPVPSASGGSLRSVARSGTDHLTSPSVDGSTDSSGSCPNATGVNTNLGMYLLNGASASTYTMSQTTKKPKKGVFKLASLAKRNRSRKDLSDTASTAGSVSRSTSVGEHDDGSGKVDDDEGISLPWNFQHNIHVDEGYIGLPPSWSSALAQAGFDEDEIAAIHTRRRAAATAIINTKQINSHTSESTERPGRDGLRIQTPSMYSDATTIGGGPQSTIGVKSFVSGVKSSLVNDSASAKEDTGSSRGEGSTEEESEQYVFVNGDDPAEGGERGSGNERTSEPYPLDTSSVSSHQTHHSSVQQSPQDQQTPRTPAFPQIQVHRAQSEAGHVPFPATSRAPSPLAHSTSLPSPTPPRAYTVSNHSASPSPSHSTATSSPRSGLGSAPPRTPARRIYHVANASSDSYEGVTYSEPPPAYVSPKKEGKSKKEKEVSGVWDAPPPPDRPIPPIPTEEILGEPSGTCNQDSREEDQRVSVSENSGNTTGPSANDIPATADDVLDISSYYSDNAIHGGDAEMDSAQQQKVLSPIPPLVIDKRMSKLATLPPRISFHQEGSLEDWSESLFSVLGSKGKRSSIQLMSKNEDTASMKKERRTTIRPITPLSGIAESGAASMLGSSSLSPVSPSSPSTSIGATLALGPHPARGTMSMHAVEEGDEQEQVEVEENETQGTEVGPEEGAGQQACDFPPSTPLLPDVSPGPNVSSLGNGKSLDPPILKSRSPPESPSRDSSESLPPSPPPKPKFKPKPKPAPLTLLPSVTLGLPRTNIITGISGRSPVNPLFGAKPQPLPIPIPPSQIRAQLRPAPPKPLHPPPTLPLPPVTIKRIPSQLYLPPQSQLPPIPSPQRAPKDDSTVSPAPPSEFRPNSSQTLLPGRESPGDRDSGLSMMTVTPATITTAKTEVVRTAIASVIDSDAVSLSSRQESVVSAADAESQAVVYDGPDKSGQSPRIPEQGEVPDDSLVSKTDSVSLLRDGPQSRWPAPPPPPVELEVDSTPRRISRGGPMASPISSHSSHGSTETVSSSTSESAPLTTPKGLNGVAACAVTKTMGTLAPEARLLSSTTGTFGGVDLEDETPEESETPLHPSESPLSEPQASISSSKHPFLTQLQPYISPRDPTSCFTNLVEIAEGESGSVFAAHVDASFTESRPQDGRQECSEKSIPPGTSHVAIKRIALPPMSSSSSLSDDSPVSNKLISVLHELILLKDLDHEHLLLLDAVYVSSDLAPAENDGSASAVDTSLWIRMELMERSLADVIGLVAEGLALQERMIGRFASDILHGLDYLQRQHIAHRDVRSDNLLVNAAGVVKLADFSNAIRVDRNVPMVKGAVGVIYWQAPEMRAGPYNALKVDIWSLGATIWELAETVPPFSMPASPSTQVSFALQSAQHVGSQWPPLTHPQNYSRSFHEFLKLCGRESAERPSFGELLNVSFPFSRGWKE